MFKINYDALGIAASVACAIHCALLPLVLTSLPILGVNIINNIWFELMMILIALFIGIYSLRHGFKKHHHNKLPIIIFSSGMALLILKQVLHAQQIWFLIPAVILIVTSHYLNYRDCRKDGECHTDNCSH
jgi:ABC-type iron transport system FetAB permease component